MGKDDKNTALAEVLHVLARGVTFHEEEEERAFHAKIDQATGVGIVDATGEAPVAVPGADDDGNGDGEELKGQALKDRAAELGIEGRSDMTADELRAAVAEAEAG